jgi:hypothetical protein
VDVQRTTTHLGSKKTELERAESEPDSSERELEKIEEKRRTNVNELAELASMTEVLSLSDSSNPVLRQWITASGRETYRRFY